MWRRPLVIWLTWDLRASIDSWDVSSRGRYVMFGFGEVYFEGSRTVARTWKPETWCQLMELAVDRMGLALFSEFEGEVMPNASRCTSTPQSAITPILR